jgi:hypothetical protein
MVHYRFTQWYIPTSVPLELCRMWHDINWNFDLYTPWEFNEFRILVHGTLSQWFRGFLLVTNEALLEFWIFLWCVVLYAIFDVYNYYPKFIYSPVMMPYMRNYKMKTRKEECTMSLCVRFYDTLKRIVSFILSRRT